MRINVYSYGSLARYLKLSGGRLTGPLYLSRDPIDPDEAATKNYIDTTLNLAITNIDASNITTGVISLDRLPDIPWSKVVSRPTTLIGYGITDALPISGGVLQGRLFLDSSIQQDFNNTLSNEFTTKSFITSSLFDNNKIKQDLIPDIPWNKILNTPTTLTGYGITDALRANQPSTLNSVLTVSPSARIITSKQVFDANEYVTKSYVDSLIGSGGGGGGGSGFPNSVPALTSSSDITWSLQGNLHNIQLKNFLNPGNQEYTVFRVNNKGLITNFGTLQHSHLPDGIPIQKLQQSGGVLNSITINNLTVSTSFILNSALTVPSLTLTTGNLTSQTNLVNITGNLSTTGSISASGNIVTPALTVSTSANLQGNTTITSSSINSLTVNNSLNLGSITTPINTNISLTAIQNASPKVLATKEYVDFKVSQGGGGGGNGNNPPPPPPPPPDAAQLTFAEITTNLIEANSNTFNRPYPIGAGHIGSQLGELVKWEFPNQDPENTSFSFIRASTQDSSGVFNLVVQFTVNPAYTFPDKDNNNLPELPNVSSSGNIRYLAFPSYSAPKPYVFVLKPGADAKIYRFRLERFSDLPSSFPSTVGPHTRRILRNSVILCCGPGNNLGNEQYERIIGNPVSRNLGYFNIGRYYFGIGRRSDNEGSNYINYFKINVHGLSQDFNSSAAIETSPIPQGLSSIASGMEQPVTLVTKSRVYFIGKAHDGGPNVRSIGFTYDTSNNVTFDNSITNHTDNLGLPDKPRFGFLFAAYNYAFYLGGFTGNADNINTVNTKIYRANINSDGTLSNFVEIYTFPSPVTNNVNWIPVISNFCVTYSKNNRIEVILSGYDTTNFNNSTDFRLNRLLRLVIDQNGNVINSQFSHVILNTPIGSQSSSVYLGTWFYMPSCVYGRDHDSFPFDGPREGRKIVHITSSSLNAPGKGAIAVLSNIYELTSTSSHPQYPDNSDSLPPNTVILNSYNSIYQRNEDILRS
ncbi:MAG: hypothetical protein QW350_05535 [Candidatus Aenigmatarchaeota archaeon]